MTTKVTLEQVASTLIGFSNEELLRLNKQLCQIIKHRNTVRRMEATVSFAVGDKVTFNDKMGQTRVGTVNKVKRVNISVIEAPTSIQPGLRWNVAGSFLRKA